MNNIYQLFPNSGATPRGLEGPVQVPQPQKSEQVGYHKFKNFEGEKYGSFEVYFMTQEDADDLKKRFGDDIDHYEPGWYWVACSPGYMPDDEPNGPFYTSTEAYNDAMGN